MGTAAIAKAEWRDDIELLKAKRLQLAAINATIAALKYEAQQIHKRIVRAAASARKWRRQVRDLTQS